MKVSETHTSVAQALEDGFVVAKAYADYPVGAAALRGSSGGAAGGEQPRRRRYRWEGSNAPRVRTVPPPPNRNQKRPQKGGGALALMLAPI